MSYKFVEKGLKLLEKNRLEEAEDEFVKAVETNEISSHGWYYLGLVREKVNDKEAALYCYNKALKASKMQGPDDRGTMINILYRLAKLQKESGHFIAAMGNLRKLHQMNPRDTNMLGETWGMLGEIYEMLKKKAYALFCYKEAVKFGNRSYKDHAETLEQDGWKPDDPYDANSPNLLKQKADILFNRGRFKEAVDLYSEALSINNFKNVLKDNDHGDVLMRTGYAYVNLQEFEKARDYFQQAIALYKRTNLMEDAKYLESTLIKIEQLIDM